MSRKAQHGLATIDNRVYNWGGNNTDTIPYVHRSPLKDSRTSAVEVFDLESLSWNSVSTTGVPPAAVMQYSCCSLGSKMYTFGGSCKPSDCYHNDLFALDTLNKEWRQVDCTVSKSSPMKKQGAGMISFTSNNEECLFVFGGFGPNPTSMPSDGQYIRSPLFPDKSFTNEMHMLSVQYSTGWTVPVVTGTTPPPTAYCTLDILPSQNKAILFGGVVVDGRSIVNSSNSVYILTLIKNQVHCQKLRCSNSPKGRQGHCSAIVTVNGSTYLIVSGGKGGEGGVTNDFWMLNIEAKQWKKINVPESVCNRINHAAVSIKVTQNRVWIIINGGFNANYQNSGRADLVTGANVTILVELVYNDRDWSVVNVWNSEQLKKNRSQIHRQLVQHLIDQNFNKGTLYELMTIMQSPTQVLKNNAEFKQAQQLYQELKEENKKLQSDVTLSRVALLYKVQELTQSRQVAEDNSNESLLMELEKFRELAEDQKKRLRGQTMELEKLRKEENGQVMKEKKESVAQIKLAFLKEGIERLQLLVIEKEELFNECESDLSIEKIPLKSSSSGNETSEIQDEDLELSKVPLSVDIGVQFSWVDVKTDYLQGLTVFGTKYFHVEGEKAHPLIWEGFGFELHLPEHTFLLKEECCIRVDAVIGGDFDIPEGVEPVSAIYVISVTTKLRQPSLLKIQHCVDLDKVHPDSGLSFYRASLKESSPPYHFKRVPGGRFDVLDKYGELELPVFCAKFIGKDQGGTQSDNSVERDDSSSSGLDSSIALDTMDDSIMYRGQLFYLYKSLNRWQVKFIVVKNIDAFAEYVAIELRDYEVDALVDIVSCVNNIKLEGEPSNVPNGWTVLHHTKPLSISMKRASAFGSEKVVSSPPFCMLTINGKDTVSDSSEELNYPLTLKDCVTVDDHNEPVINIIRTMTKAGDVSLSCASSTTTQQTNGLPLSRTLPDVSRVIASIKEEINKKFAGLKSIFDNSIDVVTAEMFTAGLISSEVKSAEAIINDFKFGFDFMNSLPEIEQHCSTFFDVLEKLGGPFRIASKSLKQSIKKNVEDKCNTTFSSF